MSYIDVLWGNYNYYNNNADWAAGQAADFQGQWNGLHDQMSKKQQQLDKACEVQGMFDGLTEANTNLKNSLSTFADGISQAMLDAGATQAIKDLNKDFQGKIDEGKNACDKLVEKLRSEITSLSRSMDTAKANVDKYNAQAQRQRDNAASTYRSIQNYNDTH